MVPSGTFDQASGGETFSPTQFGLLFLSLHAFFIASVPLSWIAGEVSVSTPAARAAGTLKRIAAANPPAVSKSVTARFMAFLPAGF